MIKDKIKIVMICHFSTAEVRKHLPLDDRRLYSMIRRLLLMPTKGKGYGDIAAWDVGIIDEIKKHPEIELHVISAHSGLKKSVVSYTDGDVHYNFVNCDRATLLKRLIKSDCLWRRLNPMVKQVHRLVNEIKPDLVLMVGLENAYISSTVLGIKDVPVLGLCQTIYNNPERSKHGIVDSKNASTEKSIFKEHRYFGVYCKMHYDLLRQIAPDVKIFKFGFPSKGVLLEPIPVEKEYDFVNFAMGMSLNKGFPDTIEATAIVKNKYPDIIGNLVGGGDVEYKAELVAMAEKMGVKENIIFTPFFEKHCDLLLHIQKSRFALLPCKMDYIAGTMTQAMQLELPLVVYKTTGTPSFNREKQCALIAEKGNVEELAQHMISLMENPTLAEKLRKNAREFQEKKAEAAKQNGSRLVETFKAIIAKEQQDKEIPHELLFNPDRDD